MKKYYTFLLIILLFCCTKVSKSQTDYVVAYSNQDTCISTSISEYDKMLRHIIPDKKEITHLYKIDLVQLARQKLNFSFEHSIKPKLSMEHEATFKISKYYDYNISYEDYLKSKASTFFDQFSKESFFMLSLGSNLKYYYNLDSRIRHGKNTNGFSGNYITAGFKVNMAFYDTDLWHIQANGQITEFNSYYYVPKEKRMFLINNQENWESIGYVNFGYGLQRRIGNVGYWSAELKAGMGTSKYFDTLYIPVELKLKVGFALPSLTRKR